MLTELCPDCGHPMNKHGWNGCTVEPTKDNHVCHCSIRPSYIMYVEAATRQADALERIAADLGHLAARIDAITGPSGSVLSVEMVGQE
jgi:hypothetical protein